MHVRTQIRNAAVTRLTGLTLTAGRVYPARTNPLPPSSPPALLVYTNDEQSEVASMGKPATIQRALELVVVAVASGNDAEDVIDQICEHVEAAIATDDTFGGLSRRTVLGSTRKSFDGQGQAILGSATLTFTATYLTRENAPGVAA